MTEVTAPAAPAAPAELAAFPESTISGFAGKKGYANKFFAELLPKFNELVELRSQYRAISGGVDAAINAAIEGLTEESNPEMYAVLNACAEAEELAAKLNAELKAWAESEVAESSANPDDIKDKFAVIKSDFDKKVSGASDFFERNEDVVELEDGTLQADSPEGELFVALLSAPKLGRGSAKGKPSNSRGKFVREYVKASGITGPEGQELGTHGVIPQWAFDAYDARDNK